MKRGKLYFNLKIDATEFKCSCDDAIKSLQEFSEAVERMQKVGIKVKEVKKRKKWWQFWI